MHGLRKNARISELDQALTWNQRAWPWLWHAKTREHLMDCIWQMPAGLIESFMCQEALEAWTFLTVVKVGSNYNSVKSYLDLSWSSWPFDSIILSRFSKLQIVFQLLKPFSFFFEISFSWTFSRSSQTKRLSRNFSRACFLLGLFWRARALETWARHSCSLFSWTFKLRTFEVAASEEERKKSLQ